MNEDLNLIFEKLKNGEIPKEKDDIPIIFQQVVIQSLLEKAKDGALFDEEEKENLIDKFEIPQFIGASLDLAKRNMTEFPKELMDKSQQVQYLYLEGNKLTELPECFFQKLVSLKWLDLRNNDLIELPTLGLKDHPKLEVLLLQGNRIKNLPLELASVPNLKGLQTAGNPIVNVPFEVIAEGFPGIIKHLKKLSSQEDILLPVSESIVVKPSSGKDQTSSHSPNPHLLESQISDIELLTQRRAFKKAPKNTRSQKSSENIKENINDERKTSQSTSSSLDWRMLENNADLSPSYPTHSSKKKNNKVISSTHHYVKQRKTRLGYKRKPITLALLQEKAIKEIYKAQMRETFEKQAQKIQRMKDAEVLKLWRRHSKQSIEQIKLLDNFQQYPTKDFAEKTPFDVDPDFLNMLSRADLYRNLKEFEIRAKKNRKGKPKPKTTALDLENQMTEIMSKLQKLDIVEDEVASPRSRQSRISNRMLQIMEIQKALKRLHAQNSVFSGGAAGTTFNRKKTRLRPVIKESNKK